MKEENYYFLTFNYEGEKYFIKNNGSNYNIIVKNILEAMIFYYYHICAEYKYDYIYKYFYILNTTDGFKLIINENIKRLHYTSSKDIDFSKRFIIDDVSVEIISKKDFEEIQLMKEII